MCIIFISLVACNITYTKLIKANTHTQLLVPSVIYSHMAGWLKAFPEKSKGVGQSNIAESGTLSEMGHYIKPICTVHIHTYIILCILYNLVHKYNITRAINKDPYI